MLARLPVFAAVLALFAAGLHAQDPASPQSRFKNKVFRDRFQAHWLPGNTRFWYEIQTGPATREFLLVDALAGTRAPAFDHARLAQALAAAAPDLGPVAPDALPLRDFKPLENALEFRAGKKTWRCELSTYALSEVPQAAPTRGAALEQIPRASRSSDRETSLRFVNATASPIEILWLDTEGGKKSYGTLAPGQSRDQHTFAGHVWLAADSTGKTLAAFAGQENPSTAEIRPDSPAPTPRSQRSSQPTRPPQNSPDGKWRAFFHDSNLFVQNTADSSETALSTDGSADHSYGGPLFWSPDSQKLVVLRTKAGADRTLTLVESSPADQLQPKVQTVKYLKPGDALPISKPHLFDLANRREIPVDDALFANPWSIEELRWAADSSELTFLYNQRGHQVLRLVGIDAATGSARAVVDEQSTTFICYSSKSFCQLLEATGEVLWMSERDGWNHLYLFDAKSGLLKNQITRGDWAVREVERVDPQARQIYFRAGGLDPGQDPYFLHTCRVNFDGTGLTRLTQGNGTHSVEFSPDRRFFIDSFSRADAPPAFELRRTTDGTLVCPLETADASALLAAGWRAPEPFAAKGRDGLTDIFGLIYRPADFDPLKKYPVIESIYAGPHGAFVPKNFLPLNAAHELADRGFIVVRIDGMGTNFRSKKFHDVAWKNLVDAGLPDRILWMKAAAAHDPALDLERVGIFGTSAGGQSALGALLTHGDFYKAAVADCGCHDNRMDKIWWNEQWMGYPVGPHYESQSNVTLAPRLSGKLLLMVGELDKNVDPSSTLQVVNALIKADKDFEFLLVPGAGHGVAGSPYGRRRLQDFFARAFLAPQPPR